MDRDISRANLARHWISYEPKVYQSDHENSLSATHALPDHVDVVRDGLLSMEKILPEDCDATLREELAQFGSADIGPEWCLHPPCTAFIRGKHHERMLQQSASYDNLRSCERISERAQEILLDSEDEWTFFWRSEIFRLFSDETREHAKFSPTFDTWSLYENAPWTEFDNIVKHRVFVPDRTQPKPDLTYAFPIETSPSENLRGFARDELTQSFSLQPLRKLVEQGVACAPKTALRKSLCLPVSTGWSSSDRSCFPWAIVEIKKNVSAPNDNAIERCYSQAANAAAAALDIQAQLFDKLKNSCPLQLPPVIAFTCVGPVVRVWLAYQDKSMCLAPPVQRMVCIWSTSVRLTWGVASLRAIIRNMHTWSSRILKPKLQAAILQATANLGINGQVDSQHLSTHRLPIPTMNHPVADTGNCSPTPLRHHSRANPIVPQRFRRPMARERHEMSVLCRRTDTTTQSRCPVDTAPHRRGQDERPLSGKNDVGFGPRHGAFEFGSTSRTTRPFGRATGSGTGFLSRSSSRSDVSIATGFGLGAQVAIKTGSLSSRMGTGVAQGSVWDTGGSDSRNVRTLDGIFRPVPARTPFGTRSNRNRNQAPRLSLESARLSSPEPAIGDSDTSSNSDAGEAPEAFSPSISIAVSNPDDIISLPAARGISLRDLTRAFGLASLRSVFRDHGTSFGTAGVPFSAHTEQDSDSTLQEPHTIAFRASHQDHSLERFDLRLDDYVRGRRSMSPSNSPSTEADHNSDSDEGPWTDDDARSTDSSRSYPCFNSGKYQTDGGFIEFDGDYDD